VEEGEERTVPDPAPVRTDLGVLLDGADGGRSGGEVEADGSGMTVLQSGREGWRVEGGGEVEVAEEEEEDVVGCWFDAEAIGEVDALDVGSMRKSTGRRRL